MEKLQLIIAIASTRVGTLIPSLIALLGQIKAKHNAKTEAEKAKAENAINAELTRLVANAEVAYAPIDALLKAQHQSAGSMKKRDVTANIKTFCLENGYAWDDAAMDKAIEDEVAYTKTVNAKKAG